MSRTDLARRIERVYLAHPEGARAHRVGRRGYGLRWFARRIHRHEVTVGRWIRGEAPVDPLALDALARLEEEAGVDGRAP